MWFPKKYHYNILNQYTTMELIKKLGIKMSSDTRKMSHCPEYTECHCGVLYRGM